MNTNRLGAIAQMLRSSNQNERLTAVTKIEAMTGMTMTDIIRKGAPRIASGSVSGAILDHVAVHTRDALIIAVSSELQGAKVDWEQLVIAGIAKPAQNEDASSIKVGKDGILRVNIGDVIPYAVGVPRVGIASKNRSGMLYARVEFDEIEYAGNRYIPNFIFIAFGEKWVRDLIDAEQDNTAIVFKVEVPQNLNRYESERCAKIERVV